MNRSEVRYLISAVSMVAHMFVHCPFKLVKTTCPRRFSQPKQSTCFYLQRKKTTSPTRSWTSSTEVSHFLGERSHLSHVATRSYIMSTSNANWVALAAVNKCDYESDFQMLENVSSWVCSRYANARNFEERDRDARAYHCHCRGPGGCRLIQVCAFKNTPRQNPGKTPGKPVQTPGPPFKPKTGPFKPKMACLKKPFKNRYRQHRVFRPRDCINLSSAS